MTKPNVHAVHRDWEREFPLIVRTEGIYLYDQDGRRYIDGSGGSSVVTAIGHGVAEIPQAMYDQSKKFSFYPAHAFTNQPLLDLVRPGRQLGARRTQGCQPRLDHLHRHRRNR